ncbi:hypothetical protein BH780_gp139 [Bacillus phage Eldridge]|uniref:Uncharacterized protein n=1 Tax=Bacillus phage Eldridge TaxID=1776293 RepID=A0A0Y0ATJ0_9CAUD|nr:hypothetical protein BH780_gp139 [Bacillus phage Eldridge]AMB18722.1 hypothetical protein Eldridge_0142 [Bacillus phage Eldridge]
MFAKKEINIFDKDKVKVGSFITFCRVQKDYEDGALVWDNLHIPQNGIVHKVHEVFIEVLTIDKTYQIYMHRLLDSPAFDERAQGDFYKIFGIIPNAIKKEEK